MNNYYEEANFDERRIVTIKRYIILRFSKANGGVYSFKMQYSNNNCNPSSVKALAEFIIQNKLFVFENSSPLIRLDKAFVQTIMEIPMIF